MKIWFRILATTVGWAVALSTVSSFSIYPANVGSPRYIHSLQSRPVHLRSHGEEPSFLIVRKWVHSAFYATLKGNDDVGENDSVMTTTTTGKSTLTPATNQQKPSTDPTPIFLSWLQDHQITTEPGNLLASMALSLLLLSSSSMSSWAAMSGGRMGGSFAPSSHSSSSGYSRSYSSPSSSGHSQGHSSGYDTGYLTRPSVSNISPPVAPHGGTGAATTSSREYSAGDAIASLIVALFYAMRRFFQKALRKETYSKLFSDLNRFGTNVLGSGTSVLLLSVALEVPNRDDSQSVLSVLHRLATTARTDSRVGLSNLTSQVALELLRRKSSMVLASAKYQHFRDRTKAQQEFQTIAIKERGKFEMETVSNYGGVNYSNKDNKRLLTGGSFSTDSSPQATMAVVTLITAIYGHSTKLSPIRSKVDVEEALRKIAADVKVENVLESCEILWTPEDRSETLTLQDVMADYPELQSL